MKTLIINLYKNEILYDIQNKTYLIGRSREDGNNTVLTADMKVNDDAENKNQILRSIRSAHDFLLMQFGGYLSCYDKSVDNQMSDEQSEDTIVMKLSMPSNFNESAAKGISSACHNYIVNSAIAEWFMMMKPDEATPYFTQADVNLQEIHRAIHQRTIPTRIKPKEQWNTNH